MLRYDRNGFVLASKKLMEDMRFQWLKTEEEAKEITSRQVDWLLMGLSIEQKKVFRGVQIQAAASTKVKKAQGKTTKKEPINRTKSAFLGGFITRDLLTYYMQCVIRSGITAFWIEGIELRHEMAVKGRPSPT